MALPDLSELDLTAEQIAEETCTVAQAAELLGCTQQNLNQVINRGALPAWRLDGTRRVMVDDMLDSQAGRAQADRLADERHRLAWLGVHLAAEGEGACAGGGCAHWTHESPADE
jgi:excisionase family DNA binding protein